MNVAQTQAQKDLAAHVWAITWNACLGAGLDPEKADEIATKVAAQAKVAA